MYLSTLSGIAPPHIRRSTLAQKERLKQTTDSRHNLFPHEPVKARLTSRKSFVTVSPLTDPPETARINQWTDNWSDENNKSNLKKFCLDPIETLPIGNNSPGMFGGPPTVYSLSIQQHQQRSVTGATNQMQVAGAACKDVTLTTS